MALFWTKAYFKRVYQTEVNGYHVQMLFRQEDNSFVEWIDNREVDRGTFEESEYSIKSDVQNFKIILNNANSFEIVVNKLNDGKPFIMKNITTDDHRMSFGDWDDVEEYKAFFNGLRMDEV